MRYDLIYTSERSIHHSPRYRRTVGMRRSRSNGRVRPSARAWVRLAVIVCLMTFAFTCGTIVQTFAGHDLREYPPAPANASAETETYYIVLPGDTLWGIAAANAPRQSDKRKYIHETMRLNGLTTSELYVGQQLILPR